jgi:small-conductance mechanosensitive channel
MPRSSRSRRELSLERMFETRSEEWEAAGLSLEVDEHAMRKAWRELVIFAPLLIAVIVGEQVALDHSSNLAHTPIQLAAAALVLVLGWLISRDLARLAPAIFKRMDPATAGTVEFLIRFAAVAITVLGALAIAGVDPRALLVGGAFTAVVLGLAAQQTLGNLFAGLVLLTARPFRLGERIRLQAGAVGGYTEGIVSSLGLMYTTLARGDDRIMIPNNVVLGSVVVPLREPAPVDVRVKLAVGTRPSHVQALLEARISTETRAPVDVVLEEIDGDQLTIRVKASPERAEDGADLQDEIIAALASVTREHTVAGDAEEPVEKVHGSQGRLSS